MIFKKPHDMKYSDMAIYIDEHIYADDCDDNLCYEYMYHIFRMIASRKRFFKRVIDYEYYPLYAATQVFLRYKNEKQFSGELDKIKSSLNYIKKIAYPLKVNYEQSEYAERFQSESVEQSGVDEIRYNLESQVYRMNDEVLQRDITYYLENVHYSIIKFLRNSPYVSDKATLHNIYLSCILSILKTITLSNDNKKRLEHRIEKPTKELDNIIEEIYKEEARDSVVLFHLDRSMENYIKTLVAKIKRLISGEILYLTGFHDVPQSLMQEILASPLQNYRSDEYD